MNNTSLEKKEYLKPNIKRYSNILAYLSDIYEYKKHLDPKFTHDVWSAELGFKSRSFMYLICSGRRPLTIKLIDILANYLELTSVEKNHLILLSSYSKTKSPDLKAIFFDKILENLDSNENVLDAKNHLHFMTSPTLPLIKLLLAFDDFKGTEAELSQVLNLDVKEIQKELSNLEKMGLVQKIFSEASEMPYWKATSKAFLVPDDRSNDIMDLFHHRTMTEAAEMAKTNDVFKRFRSILFAIDPKDHELLLSEIEQFLSKMKNRFGYNDLTDKHLLKLNLQAYPVTKPYKTNKN